MTQEAQDDGVVDGVTEEPKPFFILYLDGPTYLSELQRLSIWVERLLLPVYGRQATSSLPWCPQWRKHPDAIGYLHALWLAWQAKTGPRADVLGPLEWHRDCLTPLMDTLRSPQGPFAGCKPGAHRAKDSPPVENDGFLHGM